LTFNQEDSDSQFKNLKNLYKTAANIRTWKILQILEEKLRIQKKTGINVDVHIVPAILMIAAGMFFSVQMVKVGVISNQRDVFATHVQFTMNMG
jgi:hypothetical protein